MKSNQPTLKISYKSKNIQKIRKYSNPRARDDRKD